MTERKTPTVEQLNDFRNGVKTASTDADYDKLNAFIDEYDLYTQVYEENGKKGLKDAAGQVLVPAEYDEVGYTFEDHCMPKAVSVIKDGKFAFVAQDGKGTPLSDFVYDNIHFTPEFCYIIIKDGKEGIALSNGAVVIAPEMDEVSTPFNGLAVYKKDGKYGFSLVYEGLSTDPVYDDYDLGEDEYLKVSNKGTWGYIDGEGFFTRDEDERYFGAFFN
jgi:hypothetical protein